MSLETGGFNASETFADIFVQMYEDKNLSAEDLQALNEAKDSFEAERAQATLQSTQDRVNLSFHIEETVSLESTDTALSYGKSDDYHSENQVKNVLKNHPIFLNHQESFNTLSEYQRKAIQSSSFESPTSRDIDGRFGINTFTAFRNSLLFERGMNIAEVASYYESIENEFSKLSIRARKEYQKEGGKDGIYGPNTFGNIIKSGKDLELLGVEIQAAIDGVNSGSVDTLPDITEFTEELPPVFNNGLGLSDEDFSLLKEEIRETGTNPTYQEFIDIVKTLSITEKEQFQRAVNAKVDGKPGLGSYTHFIRSKIYEAGFSIEETATFKRITADETQDQITEINNAFNIDLNELPLEVGKDDVVRYESHYGELTIIDNETGETLTIDVAVGIFDSIELAFSLEEGEEVDRDTIFSTLDQLSGNTELQTEYIESLKEYIHEHEAYEIARSIFCAPEPEETEIGNIYVVDFRGNRRLSNLMVAQDLFGDTPYLKTADTTFINRQQPEKDFKTFNGSQRLSVRSGTSVLVPNTTEEAKIQESMDLLEREQEIREAIEDNLQTTISANNKTVILEYLSLDTISDRERESVVREMQEIVFENRLFVNMRSMFATLDGDTFTFAPGNDFLGDKLTAFDLFGDYKTLVSQPDGEEYHSITEKNYTTQGRRLSMIDGETQVQINESSLRNDEEMSKLKGIESLGENWQIIYRKFLNKLRPSERSEVLDGNKPFTLVDARRKEMIFVDGSEVVTVSVILGENGFTRGGYVPNDKKTPLGLVHRFNTVRYGEERGRSILSRGEPYHKDLMPADNGTWRSLRYNSNVQSYYGQRFNHSTGTWQNKRVTVTGVSIQSNEAAGYGGRYFHGVGPNRNGTWGCVGIKYEYRAQLRQIAAIISAKGGFGYVDTV